MPQQESGDGDTVEPGLPPKGGRVGRPGPGGGPGGQVGGGFLSFAGVRPQIYRGIGGFGQPGLPITMRKRGFQPGVTPGPPGRGDTVPAMLSPGEMVMNNGVTQDPAQLQQLMEMNQQGAAGMGYEAGGMVPPDGAMPGARPSMAIRLIQLLLQLDEQGGAEAAEPEGFAFGGMAGLGRMGVNMLGRRPGTAPPGVGGTPPPPQGGFQYNRDTEGNATNYNPGNPWGSYGANQNAFGLGALYRGVGAAGESGAYDPRGNQQLLNSQLEGAQGDADALVRRQMSQADLSGLDPAQRAVAKQQALRETGRGVQDIGAKVRAGAADRAQSFNEQMLQDLYRGGQNYSLAEQGARNDRIAQQNAGRIANQAGGGFWGQLAGNVLGSAAGSFNPFGGGGGVPRTAIAANPDPGLYNLPRPV